ncbi:MAG: PKD domain-containing protein [Euryarchaeota archaeon]|nr:PKD domain-containing protein [Euryarchaeota archaeon]MDE1835247.1 PKD domain-containing protein [Euryarchaeota archaeon]MDE2043543.1 PKD domain-containing protein [Thermoplasmata archaeon]
MYAASVTVVVFALLTLVAGAAPLVAGVPAPTALGGAPGVLSTSRSPLAPLNTCPNSYFYGSSTSLSLQNVVDCAGAGGFSGDLQITFVSMAYQESNFCPGAIQGGSGTCFVTGPGCSGNPNAEGILQQGTAGQCPPTGGPFSVPGYSASSCSTWSGNVNDWGGIYFNPLCSFQWALAYYNQNGGGDYNFWGSYLSGAYCNWAPNGFLGTGSVTCSGTGQNQANLPWSTVCPNNVCPSGGSPLSASYSVTDTTTGTSLACGATIDTGDSIQFTGTGSGGSPPYTYTWTYGDGGTGTGSTATHVYTATGTVNPMLKVTDSTGATANTGTGCSFTVAAPPVPTISSFTLSPSVLHLGWTTYANVSAQGGTPPYAYAFGGLPTGCASSNVASLTCTPTATGNFTVHATVTDARGQTASASAWVDVKPAKGPGPTLSAFTAAPSPITLGASAYFNATPTGGVLPYTYVYTSLPGGCVSSNTSSLLCTPTATGTFNVSVLVTDAQGLSASGVATLQVDPPVITPLTIAHFLASPSTLNAGSATRLSATVSGGTTPYTFSYAGLPVGCASSDAATLTCTPTASGQFEVTLTVSDSGGHSVSALVSISVTVPSGYPAIASFTAAPSPVAVGGTTVLAVSVDGGSTPYSFSYSGLPSGCSSSDVASLRCSPTSSGSFSVQVVVQDQLGHGASTRATLSVVHASSAPRITSFVATPSTTVVGGTVGFSLTVVGGTAPYEGSYSGLPTGCANETSSSFTCSPSAPGTYHVSANVTDALGQSTSATLVLTVQPGGGAPPGASSPAIEVIGILTSGPGLIALVGLAVGVITVLAVRHRRRSSVKGMASPEEEATWAPLQPGPPEGCWQGPPRT